MKIQKPCVQCTDLGVCFTNFTSVDSIVDCVASIMKVGRGLPKEKRIASSVEVLYLEHFCDMMVPRSYRFFFDMCPKRVADYIEIELRHVSIE